MSLNLDNGAANAAPAQQPVLVTCPQCGTAFVRYRTATLCGKCYSAHKAKMMAQRRAEGKLPADFAERIRAIEHLVADALGLRGGKFLAWRNGPASRDDSGTFAWAHPIATEIVDGDHIHAPAHMTRDDLYQEVWTGIMAAIRSGNPERGPLSLWAIRQGLQRAYDAIRWADRHEPELYAVPTDDDLVERITAFATPADSLFIEPLKRLVVKASAIARAVFYEYLNTARDDDGSKPDQRLLATGISSEQIDRGLNELRGLLAHMLRAKPGQERGAVMAAQIASNSVRVAGRRDRR